MLSNAVKEMYIEETDCFLKALDGDGAASKVQPSAFILQKSTRKEWTKIPIVDEESLNEALRHDTQYRIWFAFFCVPARQSCAERPSIITQANSWSRLNVSEAFYSLMVDSLRLPPAFVGYTFEFGYKNDPIGETFGGFDYSVKSGSNGPSELLISYLLKFPAKHGRSEGVDPWSIRQFAASQKYEPNSCRNQWTFIHAHTKPSPKPGPVDIFLENVQNCDADCSIDIAIKSHLQLLSAAVHGWRWYLHDKEVKIIKESDVALYTQLKPNANIGEINFSDCQLLQELEQKLRRAKGAMFANAQVLDGFKRLLTRLDTEFSQQYVQTIDLLLSQLHIHENTVGILIEQVRGSSKLLQDIITLRNGALSRSNTGALKEIAQSNREEAAAMFAISAQSAIDGRSTKIMTVVALVYLPANFIATCFGMNKFGSFGGSDVAIYLAISISLTAVTLGAFIMWERLQTKLIPVSVDKRKNPMRA